MILGYIVAFIMAILLMRNKPVAFTLIVIGIAMSTLGAPTGILPMIGGFLFVVGMLNIAGLI